MEKNAPVKVGKFSLEIEQSIQRFRKQFNISR